MQKFLSLGCLVGWLAFSFVFPMSKNKSFSICQINFICCLFSVKENFWEHFYSIYSWKTFHRSNKRSTLPPSRSCFRRPTSGSTSKCRSFVDVLRSTQNIAFQVCVELRHELSVDHRFHRPNRPESKKTHFQGSSINVVSETFYYNFSSFVTLFNTENRKPLNVIKVNIISIIL